MEDAGYRISGPCGSVSSFGDAGGARRLDGREWMRIGALPA